MIGRLGKTPIAAVGLVNQIVFILILLTFGASSGSGIFVAQYWGTKDLKNIEKTLGHIMKITLAASLVFFVILFFFPGKVLGIFTEDQAVIEAGVTYAKPIAFSTLFTAFSFIMAMAMRTVEKARVPMYISIVALGVNTIGNFLLIFGNAGFPKLGVMGAAIATLTSRVVEFLLYVVVLKKKKTPITLSLRSLISFDGVFFKRLMNYAYPVILNEFLWSLGMTMYSLVFARISTEAIATRNIVSTIENLGFVFFGGISAATIVIVGSELGKKNYAQARASAFKFLRLTVVVAAFAGAATVLLSRFIVGLYNIDDGIRSTVTISILIVSLALPVKMFNAVNIVGVLRSGGDTRAALFLEIFSLWFIGIPLVASSGLLWHWSIPMIYLMTLPEEGFKATLGLWRTKSGKWVKNVID